MKGAKLFLVIFVISVSVVQLIEVGHSILHGFQNPIHYHKIRESKDHSMAAHHFPKMKFAYEMDEQALPNNFIILAYGFFQDIASYQFFRDGIIHPYNTHVVEPDYHVYSCPRTPPPLLITFL